MPRQLRKLQAFSEMTRHFQKCVISAIACDIYMLRAEHLNLSIYAEKLRKKTVGSILSL